LAFVKTFDKKEFSSIYCEREWPRLKNFLQLSLPPMLDPIWPTIKEIFRGKPHDAVEPTIPATIITFGTNSTLFFGHFVAQPSRWSLPRHLRDLGTFPCPVFPLGSPTLPQSWSAPRLFSF
jgi:hypothetical protein